MSTEKNKFQKISERRKPLREQHFCAKRRKIVSIHTQERVNFAQKMSETCLTKSSQSISYVNLASFKTRFEKDVNFRVVFYAVIRSVSSTSTIQAKKKGSSSRFAPVVLEPGF
ncbi:MAG: hypothetical protein KF851_08655 [Pirellulaceae bacterium]|nr:hypothetical protein [Pirellulaceae bacterium]